LLSNETPFRILITQSEKIHNRGKRNPVNAKARIIHSANWYSVDGKRNSKCRRFKRIRKGNENAANARKSKSVHHLNFAIPNMEYITPVTRMTNKSIAGTYKLNIVSGR